MGGGNPVISGGGGWRVGRGSLGWDKCVAAVASGCEMMEDW